jgi:hypothetical protein
MEVLGDRTRGPNVLITVHQQRRDVDAGEDVANALGRRPGHGAEAGGVEGPHARAERLDSLRRRGSGEHGREERAHELVGGQLRQGHGLLEALGDRVGGEGTGPAGVRGGQDQGPGDLRVAAEQREGEDAAERQAGDVG